MIVLYFIWVVAILLGILSLVEGFRSAAHIRDYRPRSSRRPRVTVFCPCKGTDPELPKNLRSILDQDYPNRTTVFVVESKSDPAYAAIQSLGLTPLVAGEASNRGQKVHNLLYAVDHAAGDAEVFVFCDSDARFSRDWIANLVAPLEEDPGAISTGFRWYSAENGSFASLTRSVWNASAVTMLGSHSRNFAWGGSMAMRRETFEQIGVREAWQGAVSDDYAVTRAARLAGRRIVFVPACLIPSYGDCTWGELLEFSTRQIIITRVYESRMWRLAFFSQTIFNIAFWTSLLMSWPVCFTLYSLAGIKSYLRYQAVGTVLTGRALSKNAVSYILMSPLIALLYEYNLIRSAFTRDIVWRQIRYSLISPDRTVVQRGVSGN